MAVQASAEGRARALANLRPPIRVGEVLNPHGRKGKLSMLDAIRDELHLPADADDPAGITKNQAIARRLVNVALLGKDSDALNATKLLLAYFEGQPIQPLKLEIQRAAKKIAEETGADPLWLIAEAERIAAEQYDSNE